MQQEESVNKQEMISMEEYLCKRQKIRKDEEKRSGAKRSEELIFTTLVMGIFM